MTTRPEVVQNVHLRAFDAIASQRLPDDVTIEEQAEGLISLAAAVLAQKYSTADVLAKAQGFLSKHQNSRLLSSKK